MLKTPPRQAVFALIFLLSACFGGGHYAPVVERQGRPDVIPETHVVHRGETLYSIAWHYRKDFRELAATNNIQSPFTIYPGQRLRIKGAGTAAAGGSGSGSAESSPKAPSSPNTSNQTRSQPPVSNPVSGERDWDKNRYPYRWEWPAQGKIVSRYSSGSAVHKGIDIHGSLGEPVLAANSGKVVYAGSGLVGYGKLLIIKHDEDHLSAYGHNRRLLVREGEMVKVGQKIAEFGDTGTDKVKLHFEIRRDGKPINPLKVLPDR